MPRDNPSKSIGIHNSNSSFFSDSTIVCVYNHLFNHSLSFTFDVPINNLAICILKHTFLILER